MNGQAVETVESNHDSMELFLYPQVVPGDTSLTGSGAVACALRWLRCRSCEPRPCALTITSVHVEHVSF
jgi:hypothetical protein